MRSLYEIASDLENIIEIGENRFLSGEGELLTLEDFDALQYEEEEKVEGILLAIKNKKAEAEMIEAEIERLEKRRDSLKKSVASMTEFIQGYLTRGNEERKFKTGRVQVSYRHTKVTDIIDESQIPEEFVTVTTKRTANKAAIKNAILSGRAVSGARVVENVSMNVK